MRRPRQVLPATHTSVLLNEKPANPSDTGMANAMRILFIAGEVAPFSEQSEHSQVLRTLPEALHETGNYETRIMMPRYGTVSERRNRLHEVIRLSGSEIRLGDVTETLRVKVASIPGIRLQVYFMDNAHFFKRKGIFADSKSGKKFDDNLDRAAFYARSVIRTMRNLGWQPDLVHAFGWMSGFVPYVLRTEFCDDPLFKDAKIIYTPEEVDFEDRLQESHFESLSLARHEKLAGMAPVDAGKEFADSVIHLPSASAEHDDTIFPSEPAGQMETAISVYDSVMGSVPV